MASPGGYLPLAPGVSSVRYPIRQRTFEYVATVQSVTDETCQYRKFFTPRISSTYGRESGRDPDRLRELCRGDVTSWCAFAPHSCSSGRKRSGFAALSASSSLCSSR